MIDHWLSEDGLKTIEKSGGWPEWTEERLGRSFSHRLEYDATEGFRVFYCSVKWRYSHHVTAHEALCVLQQHAREWLEARRVYLAPGPAGGYGFGRYVGETREYYTRDGEWDQHLDIDWTALWTCTDYDAALITAINAAEGDVK